MSRKTFQRITALILIVNTLVWTWVTILDLFDLTQATRWVWLFIFWIITLYAVDKAAQQDDAATALANQIRQALYKYAQSQAAEDEVIK